MKFLALVFIVSLAFCETTQRKGCEYSTTDTVKVAWDAPLEGAAEFYEVKLIWIDTNIEIEYDMGRTTELIMEITFPRSGHFIVALRGGKWSEEDQEEKFSVWVESTDPLIASVDGESMGWWVCKKIGIPQW